MGALDEGHFNGVLENGVKLGCFELDLEDELETGAIKEAVKVLLQGLGEDVDREGLRKTPLRVAKALREGTRGYRQNVKDIVQGALFPEAGLDDGLGHAGGAGGLVVVRDLDLFSYCESCLLPFQVQCHVGYVPSGQRVVGLSKLSRVTDIFAKRLQDPQRLADEVCSALQTGIKPAGVAIVLQCWHICYPEVEWNSLNLSHHPSKAHMQGWVKMSVSSGSGVFENHNADIWSDFLALLKLRGVKIEKSHPQTSQFWCPSRSLDSILCNGHIRMKNPSSDEPAMVTAVARILRSLGEDPSRKELVGTPHRFTKWLMNFKTSNLETKLNSFTSDKMGFLRPNLEKNIVGMGINQNPEEIQSEMNLPFWSQCEHHLLPFHGVVHIGYFHPKGDEPINRSCLQKLVHFYGCKLQVQERLTRQIAETVSSAFNGDVMVVVEANHVCMISRGIEKVGSSTATIAVLGRFSNDPAARAMFLQTVSNTTASGG